jgi:hypothetical protein
VKKQSSAADEARREAARTLNAAAEQIGLALRESQPQVEHLGEALRQLADALAELNRAGNAQAADLAATMRRAVTRLQFYDRMTQHLSHVQDYLSRGAHQIGGPEPSGGWSGVHRQLSDRLLSETQRFHLDKNFRDSLRSAGGGEKGEAGGRARPGDIDLF